MSRKDVKERIENVILSRIQPELKGYDIYSIENPDNSSQSIFIVDIPESPDAPHMANHQYYTRQRFQSEPMEDHEVKSLIYKKGLRKALDFEIAENIRLAEITVKRVDQYQIYHKGAPILLIPFSTDAWKMVVSSGLLFILKEHAAKFVEAYRSINEINYLIDSLRYGMETAYTSVDDSSPKHGIWIPGMIREKIAKLMGILGEVRKFSL
jgi:hypothetical protein